MIEFFLEKYKDKTDDDLLSVINNKIDYREEAVNAAIKIYNKRNNTSIPFIGDSNNVESEQKKPSKWKPFKFIQSLIIGDYYTLLTTALFLIAFFSLTSLYGDESFLKGKIEWIRFLFFFLSFVAIHIFYKFDHKKSNSYVGRVQFDIIYLIIVLALRFLVDFIFNGFTVNSIDVPFQIIGAIFLVLLLVFLIELVIEVIKKIFQFLRLDIL